ncbi:hypothetical protein U1Q18_036446, partial [Sarracenia purpurea var. burkii]
MMRNESLDRDFARFLRTETKSFTAEFLRVDKNPDPFSPSKMASLEARIRSLKGLSPVIKEAKKATAEEILINKEEDEQENSPGEKSPSRASKLRHVSGNQIMVFEKNNPIKVRSRASIAGNQDLEVLIRSQELFRDAASVRSDLLRATCDSSVDRKCSKAAVEVADSIENEVKLAKACTHFDSANLEALEKRLQFLKSLSPFKQTSSYGDVRSEILGSLHPPVSGSDETGSHEVEVSIIEIENAEAEKKEISESNKEEARGVCASEHLSGDDAEVSDEGESEDEVSSEEINTAEAEVGDLGTTAPNSEGRLVLRKEGQEVAAVYPAKQGSGLGEVGDDAWCDTQGPA